MNKNSATKKNYFNKKNIYIYASELSALLNLNSFKNPNEVLMRIWEKNFPDDLLSCKNKIKNKGLKIKLKKTKEDNVKTINKKLKKLSTFDLKSNLEECLNVQKVDDMVKKRKEIMDNCKELNEEDKSVLEESIREITNTNFGTKNESKSINVYTQMTGIRVLQVRTFFNRKICDSNGLSWFLGGKIDGILDDGTIIEVKNRMYKLFNTLREYEKIQSFVYMFLLNSKNAKLIETYMKNSATDVGIIDIEFDEIYWNNIIEKIILFIDYFDYFINSDFLKERLLTEGIDNFEIEIY